MSISPIVATTVKLDPDKILGGLKPAVIEQAGKDAGASAGGKTVGSKTLGSKTLGSKTLGSKAIGSKRRTP